MDNGPAVFVFGGYPEYLDRVASGETVEVKGLAAQQSAIADTSNILSQAATASPGHRRPIVEAAKVRARAARIAADVCDAMIAEFEDRIHMPIDAAQPAGPPGRVALRRETPPPTNAVVSETSGPPGVEGHPPSRSTIGPDAVQAVDSFNPNTVGVVVDHRPEESDGLGESPEAQSRINRKGRR